jgi:hypothetical protein
MGDLIGVVQRGLTPVRGVRHELEFVGFPFLAFDIPVNDNSPGLIGNQENLSD